jgi:hypothetical protein
VKLIEKHNPLGADQWDHVPWVMWPTSQLQKWVDKNGGGAKNLNGAGASANGTSSAITKIGRSNPAGQDPPQVVHFAMELRKNLAKASAVPLNETSSDDNADGDLDNVLSEEEEESDALNDEY